MFVSAHAQTIVKGIIVDDKNEPIPGANILIENAYDGTTSAADGSFSFETTEEGQQFLIVRFVGFAEHKQILNLSGQTVTVRVVLKEQASQLDAVTITAGAFTAGDESRRTIFKALDIATTAGATADIAGALNTLPGTQKVGESGRLFVRGGDGSETRTFIDGMVVLDAYGPSAPNTPSRGRFLPFMFKGTSFSTGGYSAEYGQALSSALALDSRDEAEITRTDIGILSVGGDVAHTQKWDRGSVAGKIQYTNLRAYTGLINQEIDWKNAPVSTEGVAAFRQNIGKDGLLKFYGNFNESDFSLWQHDIDNHDATTLYDLNNRYRYLNSSYKQSLNKLWVLRTGASYSLNRNKYDIGGINVVDEEKGVHVKAVAEGSVGEMIDLKSGVELLSRDYSYRVDEVLDQNFIENLTAFFSEADLRLSPSFIARTGLRVEHNSLSNDVNVDPRISLALKAGKNGQFSVAWGTFQQSVRNEYLREDNLLAPEKASHYILNYQYLKDNQTFRFELFQKDYNNLIKYSGSDLTTSGSGYARGLEVFWRDNKSIRRLDYWVSYSFLDTERDYLNFPTKATPSFASAHNFSIVTKYFVQELKSQVGFTWSYASGRPYNDPNSETFNGSKTPSYQDLSFNLSYLPRPSIIVHFSCTNVLGRDNVFGYEYSNQRNDEGFYNGRAVRQAAPRFLFLGIFITLSKNKSMNQLPSL